MNIREELNRAAERLARAGSSSPRLDAEILLTFFLNIGRLELYKAPERVLTEEDAAGFENLLERRCQGEPVAYIIGVKEFWSLLFKVNREVLIPRPETEILVEETLQVARGAAWTAPRILEIGVGSGAVTVALAKELPEAMLMATDIATGALALARENARRHGVMERIDFRGGDLWMPVEGTFDLIVSNPPYIPAAEFSRLPRGVKDYEPRQALLAGAAGTAYHRAIIDGGVQHLKKGGWLLMELGEGQGAELTEILRQAAVYENIALRSDYGGVERVVRARKG